MALLKCCMGVMPNAGTAAAFVRGMGLVKRMVLIKTTAIRMMIKTPSVKRIFLMPFFSAT
jgi:hypothetical protein